MPRPARIQSLIERIATLEGHAAAIERAFKSEALKTEARIVLATLRVAADDLGGDPTDDMTANVEERLEIIAKRLSRLGQST